MLKVYALIVIGGFCSAAHFLSMPAALAQPAPGPASKFDLRIARVGETYQGFRVRPDTGESWQIEQLSWRKVVEADPVPVGNYDILLNVADEGLLPIRIDKLSGHAWFLQARQWVKYDEPDKEAPKAAGPVDAKGKTYQFRQARVGAMLHLLRFEAKSGSAWVLRGNGAFVPLTEGGDAPPAGDYDVTMIATEKNWMAFRIDRVSGMSWLLRANIWVKIKEPEPE